MAAGTHQPPDVPAPLWRAMVRAGHKYNVPPDVLAAIWRGESGSKYPNPYVNSSGYGGLFGTTDWNGSTQQQADYAASIFHNALVQTHGNILEANGIYATGKPTPGLYGHAGLPKGVVKGYGGKGGTPWYDTVGNVAGDAAGIAGSALDPFGLLGLGGGGGIASAIPGVGLFEKLTSGAFWIRALETIGGGVLVLMGFYLLARQIGLPSATHVAALTPTPVGEAARAVSAVGPSEISPPSTPARPRTRRTRVVHHYHPVGSPAAERHERTLRSVPNDYDPATSDIGF